MVGDLPDADVAPPENVLFVCKLNPVTTDDDLEIIFSRFNSLNYYTVMLIRIFQLLNPTHISIEKHWLAIQVPVIM
jgi:RNA recognition motif-containing protein